MHYRLFIGNENDPTCKDFTTRDTNELLSLILSNAKKDDVVQVLLIEELGTSDGVTTLAAAGSFASYYNDTKDFAKEMMERFYSTGRGLDIHNELNRLALVQARKTA